MTRSPYPSPFAEEVESGNARRDTCSICRFWERSTKAYLAMKADEKLTAECHFNPAIRNDDHGFPVWPRTRATDWCSKWLEKIG